MKTLAAVLVVLALVLGVMNPASATVTGSASGFSQMLIPTSHGAKYSLVRSRIGIDVIFNSSWSSHHLYELAKGSAGVAPLFTNMQFDHDFDTPRVDYGAIQIAVGNYLAPANNSVLWPGAAGNKMPKWPFAQEQFTCFAQGARATYSLRHFFVQIGHMNGKMGTQLGGLAGYANIAHCLNIFAFGEANIGHGAIADLTFGLLNVHGGGTIYSASHQADLFVQTHIETGFVQPYIQYDWTTRTKGWGPGNDHDRLLAGVTFVYFPASHLKFYWQHTASKGWERLQEVTFSYSVPF
jgi:hypothetical protein